MINLGIVIAVSDYDNAPALPACVKDAEAIAGVLRLSGRFDDLLVISNEMRSGIVKEKLISFVTKHKGAEIEDLFFYYSGHGDFAADEFYYLMTDYDERHRNQTCLQNAELDQLIRSLKPKLFVKIVDACHSGVNYIKSPDELREYLKSAERKFAKLYFMFSSQINQPSYQSPTLSDFTRKILEAVSSHQSPTVRYKDIIDYVSDAFEGDATQTPFFVIQADFTETFCEMSPELRNTSVNFLESSSSSPSTSPSDNRTPSLLDLIKKDAERYCDEIETLQRLDDIAMIIDNAALPGDLVSIYRLESTKETENNATQSGLIGGWIESNKDDKGYFVAIKRENRAVSKRVPKWPPNVAAFPFSASDSDYETTTETRLLTVGYDFTVSLPFKYIALVAKPNYPNVPRAACFIAPIVSMTHLRLFWGTSAYTRVTWKEIRRLGNVQWKTDEVTLKDTAEIEILVERILAEFFAYLEVLIKERWSQDFETVVDDRASAGSPDEATG